ncbi:MAG: FixH family protein [Devosia sp.]|nr:FixH family protein [Devosia sp.]
MNNATPKPFTGYHFLFIIVAFFGVIIAVNLTLAIASSRTWTGLVVQNSYVEGQRFNDIQQAVAAQKAAGWTLATAYQDGEIVFQALDAEGRPLILDDISAFVRRPVGGHDDTTVPLALSGDVYVGALPLTAGVWDITVRTAETELGPIEYERRVTVE